MGHYFKSFKVHSETFKMNGEVESLLSEKVTSFYLHFDQNSVGGHLDPQIMPLFRDLSHDYLTKSNDTSCIHIMNGILIQFIASLMFFFDPWTYNVSCPRS